MADAKQCDRCSRLYVYPKNFGIEDRYSVVVIRPYTPNKTLDICPECTKELTNFMNVYKEKKNAED